MFLLKKNNKIALSSNDDKRIQANDSIETYEYGTSKDLISKKEDANCNNTKIINFNMLQKKCKRA